MQGEEVDMRLTVLELDRAPVAAAGVGINGLRPVTHVDVDMFDERRDRGCECQEVREGEES